MTLPQLPREPIRPELEGTEKEKELWQPTWRCFCCHDTGLVNSNLIKLVVPDYDHRRDKLIACQNRCCEVGVDYKYDPNYDQRFTVGICIELDKISRDDWRRTILRQCELIQNRNAIADVASRMSLRRRERTQLEETEVQRRREEILNAEPEQLKGMARAYLGDEWMENGPS